MENNQNPIYLPTSLTPRIFPAITLPMPTGVNHMTPETIFIITSKMAWKKSITTWLLGPMVPRQLPKTRQKKTRPSVLVPDLKKNLTLYYNRNRNNPFSSNYNLPRCVLPLYNNNYGKRSWRYMLSLVLNKFAKRRSW